MSDIKYRIELGNCETDINSASVVIPPLPHYRADTTLKTADNTELTADYNY